MLFAVNDVRTETRQVVFANASFDQSADAGVVFGLEGWSRGEALEFGAGFGG